MNKLVTVRFKPASISIHSGDGAAANLFVLGTVSRACHERHERWRIWFVGICLIDLGPERPRTRMLLRLASTSTRCLGHSRVWNLLSPWAITPPGDGRCRALPRNENARLAGRWHPIPALETCPRGPTPARTGEGFLSMLPRLIGAMMTDEKVAHSALHESIVGGHVAVEFEPRHLPLLANFLNEDA